MHGAPTVSYLVGPSRSGAWVLACAWVAGVAACAAWAWQQPLGPWWLAWLGSLAVGAWALGSHLRAAPGDLAWDGKAWHFRADPVALSVQLDLQVAVLVRLMPLEPPVEARATPGAPPTWYWLERQGAQWPALRRALYSRAPE